MRNASRVAGFQVANEMATYKKCTVAMHRNGEEGSKAVMFLRNLQFFESYNDVNLQRIYLHAPHQVLINISS